MRTEIAKRWVKCSCCSEQIRTGERFITIYGMKDRFCESCEDNARLTESLNNEDEHIRQAEDFAAYRVAGCSAAYWEDRDSGYAY